MEERKRQGREMGSRDEPEGDEVMGEGRKMKERGAGGEGDKRIIDVGKGRSKKRTSVWIMEMQVPR